MLEFSTSAVLDGLIHLFAFALESIGLYLFLLLIAKNKFETHFFRTLLVVGAIELTKVYSGAVEWMGNIVGIIAVCYVVSFILHLVVLRTTLLTGCVSSLVIGALSLGLDHVATAFSARVIPEGPTFAEYMGLAQDVVETTNKNKNLKPTEVGLVDVMRKGLDSLATLTQEDEMNAMKADFNRGMALFKERKEWMDSLTPEEKRAYQEEMAVFLAEQGIASDRYSLAAIKDVNPTNLVALAGLFSELQNEDVDEDVRIRSIPESLGALAENFNGTRLDEVELGMLQKFAELFAKDEMDEAIAEARKDLEESQGENVVAGVALAALVQVKSGLPAEQLFADESGASQFDRNHLKELAGAYWDKKGLDPDIQWRLGSGAETAQVEVAEVELTEMQPAPEIIQQPDPFVRITIPLGIATVPSDPLEVREWIAASYSLRMKGFVSLGDELVLLREEGGMLRKGDLWQVEHGGSTFSFRIDKIMKGKVALQAVDREPAAVQE